jgi:PAS domain S-box-containing protein
LGNGHTSILPLRLGLQGEIGLLVAGAQRASFPEKRERLVLSVAANQATIGLQEARLLGEQKRLTSELDELVAQRTRELAAVNEELKKCERQARLIVDGIPGLVARISPAGEVEVVNRPLLEYFGKDLEGIRNWASSDNIYPDDLPLAIETFNNSLPTGRPFDVEHRLRRFDGVYRWFQSRGIPLRDPEGRILHWYVLLTDIEERKQAEDKLRRSETFLADGQRLSKTGTFSWSIEKDEIIWSEEMYSIFEFDPATPVTLELIGSRVHPEDVPMLEDMVARARRGESQFAYEHRIVMPEGSIKYIHLAGHTVRGGNGRLEYIGAAQDVTQRRLAEEQRRERELNLRRITQTIPGMLWSATPEGEVDYCNRPWLEFAAMTAEQAKGWGWATAIYPDDRDRLIESWHSSLTSGTPFDAEARMRRFDGAYRWFLFRANPLRDECGKIIKWYGTNVDIEDRKRREEALEASELSWRQIIDNIPGFVSALSATGEVEFINRQTLEYFGTTNEEFKDWTRLGIVHPDDLPLAIEALTKAIEAGQSYEIEVRCRRADGVYRWFQVRGRPARDAERKVTAWYFVFTDIDERKTAEEALQSNERDLNLIINTMPTLAWSARPDGSGEFFNQHYLEYVGLPLETLQGRGWAVAVHPEDLSALSSAWQSIMTAGKPGETEARLRRFDGQFRWFLFRVNPMRDESGKIVKWYGTNTDINDRKQAEADLQESYLRLTEAQRLSKTGSFITDLVADDHNWSEETFRIFEFDPSTKVTVQMVQNMVHPEDLPSFESMISRAMTGADVDFSFRILTARGTLKHIRGMARVIEHVTGRPLFIGALQDVTVSKVAEEALNRARSELAHVARVTTLNALTASIAHEVNQPLSGIITNASTCLRMLNGNPPNIDGARETARRTIRDGNRASDVITRLRALFSKKEFTLEALDLNEATREVIALSLSDLRRNQVVLRLELAADLPPVSGDRVQLQQVILNLLRNASDAMAAVENRPRELLIRTERDEGGQLRLAVKDVGAGFAPESADKLFEAFYTTKKDGMGIGLSVSRSIIEAHHGRLWATANDGPGVTFSFSIPCRAGDSADVKTRVGTTDSAST